jgi:serine/threonine-protein kinase
MAGNPQVLGLLEEMLDSGKTPEEVCRDLPELLPEVRERWQAFCRIDAQVRTLLPGLGAPSAADKIAPVPPLAGLPQVPGYEVEAVLGCGGMGVVYKARQHALDRSVALKMLLGGPFAGSRELGRFRRETAALACLRHSNIVQVYDAGEVEGRPYFAMELVEGGTLAQKLSGTPQPARQAAGLLATLAEAVEVAHQGGIVHRDLKPANILLAADGTPKIADFGLARRLEGGAGLTQSGVPMGTPSYMAPEQARGQTNLGPAVDVYALGAILYECLTGRPPFDGETAAATMHQVITHDPVPPSWLNFKVPRDLETICLKCLQKAPPHRYASARALADDLRRFGEGRPIQARPLGWGARLWRWGRRNPAMAALLAMALVVVGLASGAGVWFVQQRARHDGEVRSDVGTAVDQAASLRKGFHYAEARELLEQARRRLGPAGRDDLRRQVDQAGDELELVKNLDAARLRTATSVAGRFDPAGAGPLYEETFARAGLGGPEDDTEAVAARVRNSAVRAEIVAALDDWASITPDVARREWLLAVARTADPNPVRDRLRQPALWKDSAALTQVVHDLDGDELSPQLATALARVLRKTGGAVPLLSAAQARFPQDFWLNFELGFAQYAGQKWDDALGYYRAALAVRPDRAAVHNNIGLVLVKKGRLDDAIDHYRQALRLDHELAPSHTHLGEALHDKGRPHEAIAHFQEAIRLDAEASAEAHSNLGNTLLGLGRPDEAIGHFQEAMRLDPVALPIGHCNIGVILLRKGRHDEAAAQCRRAAELDPGGGLAHVYLAEALLRSGRFAEAHKAVRYGLDVLPSNEAQRPALRDKLKLCERLLALEARLPALLLGKERPAAAELLELARLCREYGRPHGPANLYALAFAARPALADDLDAADRYHAACAAARASAGEGSGGAGLGEPERAGLRRQALTWLRADLALRTGLFEGGKTVDWTLAFWQNDPALGGVRDPAALAQLPADEREQWQRLWADVAALRAADPVGQGRTHAARRQWAPAADAYARALKRRPTDDVHVWFEYAALLVLSGDRPGYTGACAHMIERCGKNRGTGTYHMARACTLAPDAVAEPSLPGRLSEKELRTYANQFWTLTEQGALAYRAGRFQQAVPLFERSLRADPAPGRAVLNWLWLALAHQRLGKGEEARRWLGEAQAWLDQYRDRMPDRAEQELGLHLHNWLEAHVLRREAEALIRPADPR